MPSKWLNLIKNGFLFSKFWKILFSFANYMLVIHLFSKMGHFTTMRPERDIRPFKFFVKIGDKSDHMRWWRLSGFQTSQRTSCWTIAFDISKHPWSSLTSCSCITSMIFTLKSRHGCESNDKKIMSLLSAQISEIIALKMDIFYYTEPTLVDLKQTFLDLRSLVLYWPLRR